MSVTVLYLGGGGAFFRTLCIIVKYEPLITLDYKFILLYFSKSKAKYMGAENDQCDRQNSHSQCANKIQKRQKSTSKSTTVFRKLV